MRIPKKIGVAGTGFLLHRVVNWTGGFIISPLIVIHWTFVPGTIIMFLFSLFACFLLIRLYDWNKTDWLLIESLKQLQGNLDDNTKQNKLIKILVSWSKRGKYILLIFIISWDPMVTVLYYREGAFLFNSFPKRKIFLLFIVSCLVCSVLWASGLYGIFSLWHFLMKI